jgi:tripartite-type tricarboxylate transporter receptor subunit TctC
MIVRTLLDCMRGIALTCAILVFAGVPAVADDYPSKPIVLVTWVSAGSAADVTARLIAKYAPKYLHQTMIVENRTGGDGANAMQYVLSQPADGYTLLLVTRSLEATLANDLKDKFQLGDFSFTGTVDADPVVIAVNSATPYKTLADLLAAAKAAPVPVAGYGSNTSMETFTRYLGTVSGAKFNWVPFSGGAAAIAAVMGNHVPVVVQHRNDLYDPIASGEMRGLAISSDARSADLPAVPTFRELGFKDFTFEQWRGLAARAGTPPTVVKRLSDYLKQITLDPDFRLAEDQRHIGIYYNDHDAFTKLIEAESAATNPLL